MNGISCSNTSRRALYRVFVSPLERSEITLQRRLTPLVQGCSPRSSPISPLQVHQCRSFIAQIPRLARPKPSQPQPLEDGEERNYDVRYTTKADIEKSGRDRFPQDHEITDPKIMVFQNGHTNGPLLTRNVMSKLAESESLRMVSPYVPSKIKGGDPIEYALCKIVNKKEEYLRQREAKERRRVAKATSAKSKELELNWGIGENDLLTKMRQLGGFFEKGWKVEVVMGRKKGGRKVADAEAQQVLDKVKKAIESVGGRECRTTTGQVNRTMRMYYEGTAKS